MSIDNHDPIRSTRPEQYIFTCKFDTVTGSTDPDGVDPADTDFTVATAGTTGDYTITFNGTKKPLELHWGHAVVQEDNATVTAKVTGYTPSTGVLTITTYEEDGTSGISAPVASNDVTIAVLCLFTRSAYGV